MHRQQHIGIVAFGGLAQRLLAVRAERFGRGEQLLGQIGQRQAQRQSAMLRSGTQRRSAVLAVADQLGAFDPLVQPPAQHARPIRPPQRYAGATQAALGGAGVEVDDDMLTFITILADQLLRIFA